MHLTWLHVLVISLPSITYWVCAVTLHLMGANRGYNGKVSERRMLLTQVVVDALQMSASLPRYYLEGDCFAFRWWKVVVGLVVIDWVEYWCHRAMHCVPLLRTIHKKHHNLIPVHTFGAYYNSAFEALFLGGCLGVISIALCGLSVLELSIAASVGTFFTVLDHTPAAFFSGEEGDLSDHEIHHNVCSNCNFSQPFWPLLDWLFGTRFEDVMRKEGKDPEKYLKRKAKRVNRAILSQPSSPAVARLVNTTSHLDDSVASISISSDLARELKKFAADIAASEGEGQSEEQIFEELRNY
ncbi:hypothetical protein TrRE_jg9855 [Triparma retinervis]|uniref:Fatty acid hydroxylase domain-containing protein n=1 Tax=Triparma retinervis TaxID=2557542 RepID=A0A9W7AEP1_9STRA|nr:hypothetical protein TrRE_jg9855 [Triparma retinervis]